MEYIDLTTKNTKITKKPNFFVISALFVVNPYRLVRSKSQFIQYKDQGSAWVQHVRGSLLRPFRAWIGEGESRSQGAALLFIHIRGNR